MRGRHGLNGKRIKNSSLDPTIVQNKWKQRSAIAESIGREDCTQIVSELLKQKSIKSQSTRFGAALDNVRNSALVNKLKTETSPLHREILSDAIEFDVGRIAFRNREVEEKDANARESARDEKMVCELQCAKKEDTRRAKKEEARRSKKQRRRQQRKRNLKEKRASVLRWKIFSRACVLVVIVVCAIFGSCLFFSTMLEVRDKDDDDYDDDYNGAPSPAAAATSGRSSPLGGGSPRAQSPVQLQQQPIS